MNYVTRFEDLRCWQNARKLVCQIYKLKGQALNKDFVAKDQFRRASLSIMNNIAEGFHRFSNKEKVRFLEIAQSSAAEVSSMLYLFDDLEYINTEQLVELRELLRIIRSQILSLIKKLRQ